MKKIILTLMLLFLMGCSLSNTPTKKVEAFFKKYQTLDKDVLTDLDSVLSTKVNFDENQKEEYRNIMKKHYQNLVYEIKDEKLDGDEAIVTVEITVTDFNKVFDEASEYLISHPDEFNDENGNYDISKYIDYQINRLKETKEKTKYTLDIPLTMINDEWTVNKLDNDTLNKINGIYNY